MERTGWKFSNSPPSTFVLKQFTDDDELQYDWCSQHSIPCVSLESVSYVYVILTPVLVFTQLSSEHAIMYYCIMMLIWNSWHKNILDISNLEGKVHMDAVLTY